MRPEVTPRTAAVLEQALRAALSMPQGTDWNAREEHAYRALATVSKPRSHFETSPGNMFLGGDILRPYLSITHARGLYVISQESRSLSRPRLLAEIDSGAIGPSTCVQQGSYDIRSVECAVDKLPSTRDVYLVSLTNASRYQTRRYPLNVSRLGQWLRFQHAGRARVSDLALTFRGDLAAMAADILSVAPRILGISLNFGELSTLQTLIIMLRTTDSPPILVLGNVLSAWASQEVEEICAGFETHICPSYGERFLEELCLSSGLEPRKTEREPLGPPAIVFPDERMLAETLLQGGQASVETSFGCQFGHCTFCPRDHRGKGWRRPAPDDARVVIEKMAEVVKTWNGKDSGVLSIVDEDAFGEEGIDPSNEKPSIVDLIRRAGAQGVRCEIYTRLEQIFHRRRPEISSKLRLQQLLEIRDSLARVFVGVESGANSQLRRYGKGQTVEEAATALRVGSLLGLPLEFGFITFDPLLTLNELIENLEFLARTDVLLPPAATPSIDVIYSIAMGTTAPTLQGEPVYSRVAYMATELELFANSPFLKILSKEDKGLLGDYDSSFSRFNYHYQNPLIGRIALSCRAWTEGTFTAIYRMRLAARTTDNPATPFRSVIRRYREATFGLLLTLTSRLAPPQSSLKRLSIGLDEDLPLDWNGDPGEVREFEALWQWVISSSPAAAVGVSADVEFVSPHLKRRRDT